MPTYSDNQPTANILMTSMRAMGYSFEAAIADIIDNSISAKAERIDVIFPVDPNNCCVAIIDDGCAMNKLELFDAMKYGSELKCLNREDDDLGRFGLGLKAASLSQCRKLTVASKKNDVITAYFWDLDYIEKVKKWKIGKCTTQEIANIKYIEKLEKMIQGTLVVWEKFDLIEKSTGTVFKELSKLEEITSNYLALIFHRFLNNENNKTVDIYINNYKIEGLDPFLEKTKKTNPRRIIKIPIKDSSGIERNVIVQPYVLPFQKDLTKEDIKKIGGIENYRLRQGFYIYRNGRLIIWGTWFGRAKEELTKHARIKVDIPNKLDDIWGIDIKKQSAKIPNIIKNQLTKAVDEAMDISVKTETYRGRIENTNNAIDYIWDRIKERDEHFIYKINRHSKIFDLLKDCIDDSTWCRLNMILEEIENAIPYQQIYLDKSQNKVISEIDPNRLSELEEKAEILINISLKLGMQSRADVIEIIFKSEPFCEHPNLKEKLLTEAKI